VHVAQSRGKQGGLVSWAGMGWLAWAGPKAQCSFLFIQNYSNIFELIRSKDRLHVLEKIQIKHGLVENEIRNNSPYWNFSKFGIEF
jgi:predicted peptidase